MSSAKSKFEITRNRSCNNIKENLACSSNILKNYKNLLASETKVNTDQRNYYSDVEKRENAVSFGKYYNPYNIPDDYISRTKLNNYNETGIYNITRNNEKIPLNKVQENYMQEEFSNTMFYDKIMRNDKSYNTAIHSIQNNFQTNKLKTVLNSIKFEDSANIIIPPYIKKSPLYILYPELQHRVSSDDIVKNKSEEKEVADKNDQSKTNEGDTTSFSKDPVIEIKEKLLFDVEERKSIHNYLKTNLSNNNIIRNKMLDYFEAEKNGNMIEIANPNKVNLINVHGKNNNFENAILNSYKNIHVSKNMNNKTENELKTLKVLKEQKMLIINKNEKGENVIINQEDIRDKLQRRRVNLLNDITTNSLSNNENKNGIINSDKGVAQISVIDTSNKKAVLKTFKFKNNKEINDEDEKKKKNILKFIKKKKIVKDVQVQTNKDDFEKQNNKNNSDNADSDVELIINIFNKKCLHKNRENSNTNKLKSAVKKGIMNNLEKGKVSKEGSTSKDKIKRDQEIVYNISYKTPNESNNSNTSTDDSCQNSQTCSEENDSANFSNENISKNVEEKKIDMVQNIIDYNKSLKLGIPYNIINAIPKGTNNVNTNLFKVINKFEKNSHASPYLQKNVLLKYMINKDIGKGNYKQNTTNFANYLFKNEKKKEPYAFSTMTKKMPIFFKPINKSDILKKASFNSPNSDNTILRKNIRNELSNHINSPNKNEKKKDKNEKSKIINNLLLNKLFINKQINMEKERNFKNTFTRLLKNKNFIKHKIQNSLYELKEIQYGGYTSNESSDTDVSSLFRINNFVNKKSRDNVSTSSDFNLPKNVSEKENNFSDSIKNKKYMSNEVLSLNKVSQNKLKKKLIEESDYVFSFVHTEDGSSDESLSYLKKEKQRMERLRSISYKNRLTKLSILKKNIQQFKENAKNVSKSESVHNNFDHLKHKTNEKKTKNNIPSKSDHNNNEKNEIENDTDGESEKVEVKSKVRSLSKHKTNEKEKDILTDSPNDESEKSKEIKEDEKIELKKNSNNNKLRVKANLKSITSKDEGGKKTEACLRSTSHEKGKIQNSIDKEKINTTNYTDTEMEIKKKNSRELSLKTYNGAYLKKRAGSGGGNYLKIKSVSLTNAKNVEKNETRGVDENDKHDNICQLTSLERIDPNKWVQRIFGDT
ncbi:conserved Plasmodium protein, unknown function [Plasmodium vinckei vinckei]|uniref:Uncharacterized protein n=1 Tax=Plasmodium vinckei vinckei TaxID=54757 RepID=A0A449BSH7_PLAVN|nr:conserved Plasmodium protein, unknown function [Plasmodium vinckei vinckei]KEG02112.1 hypothetical protein YYE_02851 [Plasmodium vinckei vinckei]VEV56352.1 conserved Plasmodium protein, unknown function [Plasmodium vinckei vinckei]